MNSEKVHASTGILRAQIKREKCVMRKKALLVTSVLIVILALILVTVVGCTPKEATYSVTLNLGGDETEVRQLTNLNVAPEPPAKAGYEFDAWYVDAELQTKATFPMELKENVTLYAKYLQQFTLTLVSQGSDKTTQTVAKLTLAPAAPTREGYTFAGWYLDSSFKKEVSYPYVLTADTTFYAKWVMGDGENFTVKFVTNGGTPVDDFKGTVIETSPVTTKEGWVFAGWYTRSSLLGSAATFPLKLKDDTTLYAKWVEDSGESSDYTYINQYKNAKSSLEALFSKFPERQRTAVLDIQTTMTTDKGTAQIDMQGNFNIGGQNEFMFRISLLDNTAFAVYFIGNEMYMDAGDGSPLIHFTDIKPDYIVAFLGDLLVDMDLEEILGDLSSSIGGMDIAGMIINLLFNSPYYTATVRNLDNTVLNETYNFEIKLNSLVSGIKSLLGLVDLGSLIGFDLNLTPLFDWLNSTIPQLKVYFIANLLYDEELDDTVVTTMQLTAEDNNPDNDVDGEIFSWIIDKADIRAGYEEDLLEFPVIETTREFSLSNIQFDLDLNLYTKGTSLEDANGLDVAKLINLFAPDLNLPENMLVLNSEFGYRLKANVDLDLNYAGSDEDKNLIALEIYAIDRNGDIILTDKVPMLLGIYYRNGSIYVSLNSMMPNYWKANNIKVDGINLKGVVSYLTKMITDAIDEHFGTNWEDYKSGTGAQSLNLSSAGRDIITLADGDSAGEDVVYISPTIQTLITAVASVVGFQEAVYATEDQIVIEVNQKLFNAINQFMGDNPIQLPIALDGKVALNIFDKGIESVEVTATVGVPDKDGEGNVVKDENGNLVTSDPVDVKLKAHNFMIGFNQNEFTGNDADSLDEYIESKLVQTTYTSNLGELLSSVLSGVDLNAHAKMTFNQGTYQIGKFLEELGIPQLQGVPLEWTFTDPFNMDVELSVMISIDRNTRSNSMFAIEVTTLAPVNIGSMTGMDANTVMLGVYGFYTQDTSSGTGEWVPHILLDLTNIKIMNITLPRLSIEFDFVQTLLDLFDNIKIGDELINDFDLNFDIMSLFGGNDDSASGDAASSAMFAESDGTAAGTTLSDLGMIIIGLNAEQVYASLTLAAIGNLLSAAGVSLGDFDLGSIDLGLAMDITRTEGWTINASGEFMPPKNSDQEQNFNMLIEIGTEQYPLTVGYVRDKLVETKNRVQGELNNYTDDLVKAIIDTVGVLSIDVTMDLQTFDSHVDFTKIINNILISQGQYLDLPIDLYLDDWQSTSTVTLKWDLDLETVTNSKLLLAFKYGEKEILSLGVNGGDIILDLRGLGLFAIKLTNSSLVNILIGYLDQMIADIGDLNLSDIINGLLTPEEEVDIEEVADNISQGLNLAEPTAEESNDATIDLIMMLLSGVYAENVNLYLDVAADTIDKIFKTFLGVSLGFDVNLNLGIDMVGGELDLNLGLSDVVDFNSSFKLQVGGTSDISFDTSAADIDASSGKAMAKTLLDNLNIALSIDVLSNNIDTGGSNKYLRLSVEKLNAPRVLTDAAKAPTIAKGAFLVTISRVNNDNDFNDTTITSNTKPLAYIALDYNKTNSAGGQGVMSIYLAKNNISLVVDFGEYVAINVDLDLVTTLGDVFKGLIEKIEGLAAAAQGIETTSVEESEPLALAEGDTTATEEEPSPFAELFADLDVLKLLDGGIDIRLTSTGVFNVDVSFNAYEINKMIDGVMSLIFGPNTILNLAELAPDMFGSNYLANVNWDRVNDDSRGFWQTLKAQLTPLLKEVVANMVSSALSPLITDTLLNSTYEEIHDILMRLLPLPVFNRLNVGITTLDGTFANLYIKGYDDNEAVVNDANEYLSNTTYNGDERETEYKEGNRSANYKTELYLFNKSPSVGDESNNVSGDEQEQGIVDWGDITTSVNFEPYEYSDDNATAYSQLYNKYFANKTARYQYKLTVQKADVKFYVETVGSDGRIVETELTSSTMDLLNVGQISKDTANSSATTVKKVIAKAIFSGTEKSFTINVNILPKTDIMSVEPIETHAYDDLVDEITINLMTGVSRSIRTEEMTAFSYTADTYLAHDKTVSVTFKNGVSADMTVHFLDSTVTDIIGSGDVPNTFTVDMYAFTNDNRKVERFTPEYLYIIYEDGAMSRIKVDKWDGLEETAKLIENKLSTDMSSVTAPVTATIAMDTAAVQVVNLTVSVKTKIVSALGIGSTLDALEINPYTYFLNMIDFSETEVIPNVAMAYYYEEATEQSYNEQVNVNINITADTSGYIFSVDDLRYDSIGTYQGKVVLDKSKYGDRMGIEPDTEGYDQLAVGYFGWEKDINVNVVSNLIVGVYFDEELTQEIFTVHPYEYNALSDEGKMNYFPKTAYVKFSSNTIMEMPIRWYDGSGQLFDPLTYKPEYEPYSEQWQIEIGFVTDEYKTAAEKNGQNAENLQSRFLQKANVGVFVDGMKISKLNIAGAGSGDDYYEVNPIDVLYLGKDAFPSTIEVTYEDGSTANIGVYQWVGMDDIDISMSGSEVRTIEVMLTQDGEANFTIRYKVVAKDDPIYAYDNLVLDPFGYVTVEEGSQTINKYNEFGDTLEVVFRKPQVESEIMPLEDEVFSVRVQSWNLTNVSLSSGKGGNAVATVLKYDGTTIDVTVPVKMKTIATKEDGSLDLSYQYYGYDFIAVMYDTSTGKYFANFSDEVQNTRFTDMTLTLSYWCEEDFVEYTEEPTPEIADKLFVGEDGKTYMKVYTTRSVTVEADLSKLPPSPNLETVSWYYLDEKADSAANMAATSYMVNISFRDGGGQPYGYEMKSYVCVMGVSESATATEGN